MGGEDIKEGRRFSKTLERAVTNFWTVMGESGGRTGELMESRGVGGISAITGRVSFGKLRSEEDDVVMFDFVDQLITSSRGLTGWKSPCSESSMPEKHSIFNCTPDFFVVLV